MTLMNWQAGEVHVVPWLPLVKIYQLDFKLVFLNAYLEEKIYINLVKLVFLNACLEEKIYIK